MDKAIVCSRCGSTNTWLENQLIFCARFSHWKLPYRDEKYSRMEQICLWNITLCMKCAIENYKESLTKTKESCYLFMTKIAPILLFSGLGAAFIMVLVVGNLGGASGAAGAMLLAYLAGCGLAVVAALIGFPISLIMFLKSSNKLRLILSSSYHLSESEKMELVNNEGNRIIDCIKSNNYHYYGNFALPEPRSWSTPPFNDLRLKSDAIRFDWSCEIVISNRILEYIDDILSMSTVMAEEQLYSLCDDFIDQLYRTNQIEEKKYAQLKSKITEKKEESKQQKDKIENEVFNEQLSGIMSEGPKKFGEYGGFADPMNTIPKFIKVLNHSNKNVQKAAADALKYLSGEDYGVDEHRWREWWRADGMWTIHERLKKLFPNNSSYT